ncbi:hypothetical protein BTVI_54086 [Pitangus sulphuratus]|nr:hypothetical protein BTVI_54086 [Pitangus sulphuratus]
MLDDNFMERVLREPAWKGALLDLLLVKRVDLINKVETGSHLGHSDHEMIEFKISVGRRKSASKTSALDMRRADFTLLRELMMDQGGLSAWRNMTGRMINSQSTLILWDLLLHLNPYKSMRPDGIHPKIFKDLADVTVKPLLMIFEWS